MAFCRMMTPVGVGVSRLASRTSSDWTRHAPTLLQQQGRWHAAVHMRWHSYKGRTGLPVPLKVQDRGIGRPSAVAAPCSARSAACLRGERASACDRAAARPRWSCREVKQLLTVARFCAYNDCGCGSKLWGMTDKEFGARRVRHNMVWSGARGCARLPLIHPESAFRVRWDLVAILLVLYTSVFVPYRVAFMPFAINFWFVSRGRSSCARWTSDPCMPACLHAPRCCAAQVLLRRCSGLVFRC